MLRNAKFNITQMVFMGLVLSDNGIGPAEDKVRAIVDAREPQSASEVRSFQGLANYNARFIPDFATVAEPLRRLTKKGVHFSLEKSRRTLSMSLRGGYQVQKLLVTLIKMPRH